MWQYGNYELNRLDIGRVDLAVLQDLGHQIKTYEGLPLFELSVKGAPCWILVSLSNRTGAAWAVQVAGYTPRAGKRKRGIKRANTGNGGGRVAKGSQGHRA